MTDNKIEPSGIVSWIIIFKASVSDFGVFIQLFGCLCHFVGAVERGIYLCIVDLKNKR